MRCGSSRIGHMQVWNGQTVSPMIPAGASLVSTAALLPVGGAAGVMGRGAEDHTSHSASSDVCVAIACVLAADADVPRQERIALVREIEGGNRSIRSSRRRVSPLFAEDDSNAAP